MYSHVFACIVMYRSCIGHVHVPVICIGHVSVMYRCVFWSIASYCRVSPRIGVYSEGSHRIVVYRHVSVCILKYHIVLSCIGLDTGIARPIPVRLVSPDRYLDTGIARPIPGRYLVFFVIGILRVFVCIWKASSIRTDTWLWSDTSKYRQILQNTFGGIQTPLLGEIWPIPILFALVS